jgi:hypothetical protein
MEIFPEKEEVLSDEFFSYFLPRGSYFFAPPQRQSVDGGSFATTGHPPWSRNISVYIFPLAVDFFLVISFISLIEATTVG